MLNDLRRELVARLDAVAIRRRTEKVGSIVEELGSNLQTLKPSHIQASVVKIRLGQPIPPGNWDEVVVAIGHAGDIPEFDETVRLALPVFTKEGDYNRLRGRVKTLLRAGYRKWEAADLAGVRMLRALGVEDLTADWTLYAFNALSSAVLAALGVRRCVLSPEDEASHEAEAFPIPVEHLVQQSTPLFLSVTKPAVADATCLTDADGKAFTSFFLDGLWVTTRSMPRTFPVPSDMSTRLDLSWDCGVRM